MDQITGNPRSHDEGTSGWKFAHQRLSQMLIDRVQAVRPLDYDREGECSWHRISKAAALRGQLDAND